MARPPTRADANRKIGWRAVAVVAGAALGCHGPRPPGPPIALPGTVKHYAPLAMAADANLPGQVVILGSDDRDGSTVLPIVPRPVVVEVMIAARGSPDATALAITLTAAPVTRAPSGAPGAAPGAAPAAVAGAGDAQLGARWRAELARATLVAATAVGKDVTELALLAVPAGSADDATAAAVLAGGLLAALTGERVDPAATLVGTLGPDGTIGAIDGVPELMLGAIVRGKTRIGYPRGMRLARSRDGNEVDLDQLAKAHHVEAIELADVHDAYRLLTRKPLPAPVALPEADLALDPAALRGLDDAYLAWQQRLAVEWAPLLQLEQAGRLPAAVARLVRRAREHGEQAEAMRRARKLAAAADRVQAAWIYAAAANATTAVLAKLEAGDVDGAITALAALDTAEPRIRAALDDSGARRPATIDGHLAMLDVFQAALQAWADHALAVEAVRRTTELLTELRGSPPAGGPATLDALADAVAPAVLSMLRATAQTAVAEQALERAADRGVAYTATPLHLKRVAATLQAASAAQLRYIDAIVVEPLARRLGLASDEAHRRSAALDPGLGVADRLAAIPVDALPSELAAAWGDGSVSASLLQLAGPEVAYGNAALVITRHDALGDDGGGSGSIDARALRSLLGGARRTARASARAARIATGEVPLQARLAYQRAAIEDTGDVDDQLDALAALWAATAWSQAAVMLARN